MGEVGSLPPFKAQTCHLGLIDRGGGSISSPTHSQNCHSTKEGDPLARRPTNMPMSYVKRARYNPGLYRVHLKAITSFCGPAAGPTSPPGVLLDPPSHWLPACSPELVLSSSGLWSCVVELGPRPRS